MNRGGETVCFFRRYNHFVDRDTNRDTKNIDQRGKNKVRLLVCGDYLGKLCDSDSIIRFDSTWFPIMLPKVHLFGHRLSDPALWAAGRFYYKLAVVGADEHAVSSAA